MKTDDRGPYAIYPVIKGDKKLRTYEFPAGTPVENGQFHRGIIEAGRNANLNIEVLDEPEIQDGLLTNPVRIRGRYCLTDENGMLSAAFAEQNIFINSNGFPKEKRRRNDDDRKIDNHHWDIESGRNEDGDDEIKALFNIKGDNELFKYPKPVALIRKAMTAAAGPDSIIVDFFAGSGTTGHAVMAQNAEDGGNRRFILVQLPEPLSPDKKDQKAAAHFLDGINRPRTIAELTKERLRRAGAKIRKDNLGTDTDTGFRVYRLSTSNLKPWQPDSVAIEASILDAVDNILPDRTQEDVLTELLIKTGIDLSLPQEKRIIAGQAVYMLGEGALFISLGEISADMAELLAQGMADWAMTLSPSQTTIYFKDSGLGTDGNRGATKANLAAILRQRLGQRIAKIASI